MWGNSEKVAREVAAGVGEVMPVDVVEVSGAPTDLSGTDLVVAGGPTHAFSMSRVSTRRDARTQGAPGGSVEVGLREWLEGLPDEGRPLVRGLRHPGDQGPPAARLGGP